MKKFILFFITLPLLLSSQNMQQCGTDEYLEHIKKQYPEKYKKSIKEFKDFLIKKKELKSKSQKRGTGTGVINFPITPPTEPILIPIVFHIIHNGEPIGVGSNVSELKIEEQLSILNQSFGNPPTSGEIGFGTPTNPKFQFCLAKTDPFGEETNGITRRLGPDYYVVDNPDNPYAADPFIKQPMWNSNAYLNVWVTDIRTSSDISNEIRYGGYSSFPFFLTGTAQLDGVVLNYRNLGINTITNYPDGNSLTHEIGHWLGLYHVFLEESCADANLPCDGFDGTDDIGDELCDTPPMDYPSIAPQPYVFFSNNNPNARYACYLGQGDVVSARNFMDYHSSRTFFTEDQVERMHDKTWFFRSFLYNNNGLNTDCTYDDINVGGGGGSGCYAEEPPGRIVENPHFNGPNSPFTSFSFGEEVDLNDSWLVTTETDNHWLHIFKRVDCEFIPFQSIHQGNDEFGRDLILTIDEEIIVSGKNYVFIYKYDGNTWFLNQSIERNAYGRDFGTGIFIKDNFLFVMEDATNNNIYVYKKGNTGMYSFMQTISGSTYNLPAYSYQMAPMRNIAVNSSDSKIIAYGYDKLLTISLVNNSSWSVSSTTTHSEWPEYKEVSIATSENNIYVMISSNGGGGAPPRQLHLYTYPLNSYNVYNRAFNFNNGPYTYQVSELPTPNCQYYLKNLKVVNDNFLMYSHKNCVPNERVNFIEKSADGNWINKVMPIFSSPYAYYVPRCPSGDFTSKYDLEIYGDEIVFGSTRRGKVFVYKLSDLFNSTASFNQLCSVPTEDEVYASNIFIGGQCSVTFNNVNKQIKANNSIKLLNGTKISGGNVKLKITSNSGCSTFVNTAGITQGLVGINNRIRLIEQVENEDFDFLNNEDINSLMQISPNPAKDFFKLQTQEEVQKVEIYDVNGRVVKSLLGNQEHYNISTLEQGIYLVKVFTENNTRTTKLVKE